MDRRRLLMLLAAAGLAMPLQVVHADDDDDDDDDRDDRWDDDDDDDDDRRRRRPRKRRRRDDDDDADDDDDDDDDDDADDDDDCSSRLSPMVWALDKRLRRHTKSFEPALFLVELQRKKSSALSQEVLAASNQKEAGRPQKRPAGGGLTSRQKNEQICHNLRKRAR